MNFGFLILHYKNFDITKRCVDSIKSLDMQAGSIRIIIVDNGSCDESTVRLHNKYVEDEIVELIVLKDAFGFSRGNNIGYEYACTHYDFDYLIVTNNDIIFNQKSFLSAIVTEFENYKFYVLGPDMIDLHAGAHLNPKQKLKNEDEVKKWVIELEKKKKGNFWKEILLEYFQESKIYPWYSKYIRGMRRNVKNQNNRAKSYSKEFVLQGGCLIFSRQFIEKNKKLFWPETTFYGEESILFYRCKKNNWSTLYSPKLTVLHEQGSSFRKKTKQKKVRHRKAVEYNIEAAHIYLDLLKDKENNNG